MLKNIGSNWLLMVVTILATYFLLPFNLHALGREQYGVWLLITAMTGYLGLMQLGVPMASVRYLTRHITEKDHALVNKTISTCAGLYLLMGAGSLVIGGALLLFFEKAYAIPPGLHEPARWAFVIVLLNIAAGFFGQLPYGIMSSHHDFVARNLVQMVTVAFRFALNIVLIKLHPSLLSLAIVQLASILVETVVIWSAIFRMYKEVRLTLQGFNWPTVSQILSFSFFVLVLNLGTQLSFQTDSLVIGKFLNVDQIPLFTVGNSLVLYLMQFVIGIASVVMPMATKLETEHRLDELKSLFLKWSKVALSLSLVVGLYLLVYGRSQE